MNRKDFLSGVITGFVVGVLVMAFIFMGTSCAKQPVKTLTVDEILAERDKVDPYEWLGCLDGVCNYTFASHGHRCFISIGQANSIHVDSFMFDLECP